MIETNLPQSGDDNAHGDSSGESEKPAIPAGNSSGDTEEPQPAQEYFPPFSRKRLTRRQWQLAFTLMGASILISAAVVAANLVTVPYVSISPGSVYSLSEAVSVDSGDGEFAIYPPESDMGFVTVRRSERLNLWRLFFDALDSRVDIRRDDINRGLTEQQLDRLRALQMLGSQGNAVEIALTHLGRTRVTLLPDPEADSFVDTLQCFFAEDDDEQAAGSLARFRQTFLPLLPDEPTVMNPIEGFRLLANPENGYMREDLSARWQAYSKFLLGDTVVSVDGMPVANTSEMRAALEGTEEGEPVSLEMQFFDQPVHRVSARLGESFDENEGIFSLSIENVGLPSSAGGDAGEDQELGADCPAEQTWLFLDWPDLELMTRVTFDTGDVGGPSAGLAFALAVVDLLTEGDLTGGLRVATTGIFSSATSDSVSSVGGVPQKTVAVRNSGYDVFLVPENDYDNAISAAGDDLRVEKVTTLRDALATLECLGGDPVLLGDELPGARASAAAQANNAELAACS